MATIIIKRGQQENIENVTLAEGELALAYNADKTAVALYAGDGNGGKVLVNPDVSDDITGVLTQAKGYTDTEINNLINGAPEAMDTLKELADAIEENSDLMEVLNAAIGNKVDKVDGMGLSSNDYTAEEKTKLAGIATGANNYVHPSSH
ncbi:MAG: hypothetical protein ACI4A5_05515, partial [Hominilimicola sp.]